VISDAGLLPGVRWVVLLEAINDVGFGFPPDVSDNGRPTADDIV
jgi:hypothetical protein